MSVINSELSSLSCHRLTIYWMHEVWTSIGLTWATVGSSEHVRTRKGTYRYHLVFQYIQLWSKGLLDRRSLFSQFSHVVETQSRSVVNKILRSSEVRRFVEIVSPWDGVEFSNLVQLLGIQYRGLYLSPQPHWCVRSVDTNALSLC